MNGWEKKPDSWENNNIKLQIPNSIDISNHNNYKNIDIDCIFVLAGGLDNKGGIHEWVIRRLNLAYDIYINHPNKDNIKIICLGGGTYHKPPILNDNNYVIHESTACTEYLIKLGIKSTSLYKEWSSYDTIANGYFAYTNYINTLKLKNIMVITSEFHMPRSRVIFNWINKLSNEDYNLYYESASDKDLPKDIINIRVEREKTSLFNLISNVFPKINNLNDFTRWFYEEHKAYSCNITERENIDSEIKKTY